MRPIEETSIDDVPMKFQLAYYAEHSPGEGCATDDEANACYAAWKERLISAAPEMLAALERSLNWLSSYPGEGAMSCYDQARAAIFKATGDQP